MRFFVQLCTSWQDFNWSRTSRGPSAILQCVSAAWSGLRLWILLTITIFGICDVIGKWWRL